MSALDTLPADQRAVLQLVLKQGRTYEQIAGTLRMGPDAVADRAHRALDALGPEPPAALSAEQRAEIADYLLGQMSATGRARVRDGLEESAAARAWARVVRAELRPLGGDELPEVPADPREADEAFDALSARRQAHERHERSSRLGGILLLVGLAAVVVAAILWATGVFGGGDSDDLADTPPTSTQPQDVRPIAQANLTPANEGSNALGVAFVVSGEGQQAIRVDVEGLPRDVRQPSPEAGACIFLTGAADPAFVGCFQEVSREGAASASGVLQDADQKPIDVRDFERVVVTRETGRETPTRPGRTILSGEIVAPTTGQGGQGTATTPQDQGEGG